MATIDSGSAPDYAAIKARQNQAWGSGDYARVGVTIQITGEHLAESMDLPPGSMVLDVAAGNGNATLAFARRWCAVTSTDFVEALLMRGRARAEAESLTADFRIADAEHLPFGDDSFDAVVSTFGVMFTPDQTAAGGEMMRVCRPGGRIGMANWTPDGFIGQVFRTLGRHVPPPAGLQSPARWGTESWLREVFGPKAAELRAPQREFMFRYRSAGHFIEYFRNWYGPMHKAFLALDTAGQDALTAELTALIGRFNTATDGTMRVPGAYLEVVITKA